MTTSLIFGSFFFLDHPLNDQLMFSFSVEQLPVLVVLESSLRSYRLLLKLPDWKIGRFCLDLLVVFLPLLVLWALYWEGSLPIMSVGDGVSIVRASFTIG
jgi:hypothetical protein